MSTTFNNFILFVSVLAAYFASQAASSPTEVRLETPQLPQMNWTRIPGPKSTYYVSGSGVNAVWSDARVYCYSAGYDLLSIETEEEWEFLLEHVFDANGISQYYWTSAFYQEGSWTWPDGIHLPSGNDDSWNPWHPNQPVSPGVYRRGVVAYYMADNRGDWTTILDSSSTRYICESVGTDPTEVEPCLKTNDLVLVLDASGSIGSANFEYLKDFAARLVPAFNIHPESRVSVTKYETSVTTVLNMTHGLSPEEVEVILREMPYGPGGGTATGAAIADGIEKFAQSGRPGIPRNMVIVTDGVSNSMIETITQANLARTAGITTFAVGISAGTEELELVGIAGHGSRMYRLARFDQVEQLLRRVSRGVCANSNA